jgi:AcrR family transcriptional regulator
LGSVTVGELAPERLEVVLRTAAREFAAAGYEHASLNRIIAECAMSKSSFYHYFDSKAALFDTVVRRAMAGLAGELAAPPPEALDGPEFWDHLEVLAARVLDLAARTDWYADAARLFYLPDAPAAESPAVRESTAAIRTWFAGTLAVGRRCGQVRDDLPGALQAALVTDVVRSLDTWSLEHVMDGALDRGQVAALLVDLLRRLLAPGPGGSAAG